jgi:predicted transcriptional regulator
MCLYTHIEPEAWKELRQVGRHDAPRATARRAAGELEAETLAVLQAAGVALTPGQVRERLGDSLAYTTVVTILSRLHAKGVLTRLKSGRAYSYTPVADEPGLAARSMRRVLDAQADRDAVLARFVSGLSAADEDLLRRMLTEHGAVGGADLGGRPSVPPGGADPGGRPRIPPGR